MILKTCYLTKRANETKHLAQHESSERKGWLNENIWKRQQKLNRDDKSLCERKELDDWSSWKDDYTWNTNTCDCECKIACNVDEYLDFKKYSFQKRLFQKCVLSCDDEVLNTLSDKNVISANSCLIKLNFYTCFFYRLLSLDIQDTQDIETNNKKYYHVKRN